MLFPKPGVAEGHPTTSMPVFLSGEKRQAVRTSTLIPPGKTVKTANWKCNRVQLQNHLYAIFHLCDTIELMLPRSKYSIDLSRDLDDAAVSLLIYHGLGNKFPTACDGWASRSAKSKAMAQKEVLEGKRRVDEQLENDKPLLGATLAREMTRRISDAYPYAFFLSFWKNETIMLVQFARPEEVFP